MWGIEFQVFLVVNASGAQVGLPGLGVYQPALSTKSCWPSGIISNVFLSCTHVLGHMPMHIFSLVAVMTERSFHIVARQVIS